MLSGSVGRGSFLIFESSGQAAARQSLGLNDVNESFRFLIIESLEVSCVVATRISSRTSLSAGLNGTGAKIHAPTDGRKQLEVQPLFWEL